MMTNSDAYYSQTQKGESRWWSWGAGLWFTIVGAIFFQTVLTSPIPDIAGAVDPEYTAVMEAATEDYLTQVDLIAMGTLMGGIMLLTLLAGLLWLINRTTQGTLRKISGWISGLSMVGTVILGVKVMPMTQTPELMAAFNAMLGASPLTYMLMLATFPAILIGLYLVQKFLHKRPVLSLHTAAKKFRWNRVFVGIAAVFGIYAIMSLIGHFSGLSKLQFVFDPARFFGFALISLMFIPLQSATEEILIRGYMNQGLVSILKNKWIVYILTSLVFMSLHLANPEATEAASKDTGVFILTMSSYFLFGFLLSIMVDFEGGLEAAIGVHAANNLFAAIFVNYENSVLPTPSVFLSKVNPSIDLPIGMIGLCAVTYIVYRSREQISGQATLA